VQKSGLRNIGVAVTLLRIATAPRKDHSPPMKHKFSPILVLGVALALAAPSAHADERESIEALRDTTLRLINALVHQGVLSQAAADALVRDARPPANATPGAAEASSGAAGALAASPAAPAPPATVPAASSAPVPNMIRVPYVPELVKKEIREQLKEEVIAQARAEHWADPNRFPDWLTRIKFDGDIRLRVQNDVFRHACNVSAGETTGCNIAASLYDSLTGATLNNTTEDRQRFRLRVRQGLEAKVSDSLTAGIRIATGSLTEPVSTNATLGGSFDRLQFSLDRGYVQYAHRDWLTVVGGRFANPWLSTDLLWSENLNFDGAAATLKPQLTSSTRAFLTVGAFAVQDIEPTLVTQAKSKWLYAAQFGGIWTAEDRSSVRGGVALYEFKNIAGVANASANDSSQSLTAPQYLQKGNSLYNINGHTNSTTALYGLASKFRELDATVVADLATYEPVHVTLTADVVKNIGFDSNEIQARSLGLASDPELTDSNGNAVPLTGKTRGYHLRLGVGTPALHRRGDWQSFVAYKYLERDAVLDAFTDSDFHLGGTNAKGYIVGGSYGFDTDAWLTARYLSAEPISGLPLSIDVLQLDLNVRF
jgi:hypothetical protein